MKNIFTFLFACALAGSVVLAVCRTSVPSMTWWGLGNLAWLVPVGVLAAGAYTLLTSWCIREGDLSPVAVSRVKQSLAGTSLSLVWGAINPSALGLLTSNIVNASAGFTGLLASSGRHRLR